MGSVMKETNKITSNYLYLFPYSLQFRLQLVTRGRATIMHVLGCLNEFAYGKQLS
jgi:hypothetical protein